MIWQYRKTYVCSDVPFVLGKITPFYLNDKRRTVGMTVMDPPAVVASNGAMVWWKFRKLPCHIGI